MLKTIIIAFLEAIVKFRMGLIGSTNKDLGVVSNVRTFSSYGGLCVNSFNPLTQLRVLESCNF